MRSDPGHAGHVRRAATDRSALQGSEAGKPRRRASAQGVGRSRKVAESKLGVSFQEVVHSVLSEEAEVAEASDFRGRTEWTLTRMRL